MYVVSSRIVGNEEEFFKNNVATDEELESFREHLGEAKDCWELGDATSFILNQSELGDIKKMYPLTREVRSVAEKIKNNTLYFSQEDKKKYDSVTENIHNIELDIAAKFIDDGEYSKFNDMLKDGFDATKGAFDSYLMNRVRTLKGAEFMETLDSYLINRVRAIKGAEFMETKGLISEDFFKSKKALLDASPEQIGFYIKHGADVNDKNEYGTVLDSMIFNREPLESIEKVFAAGGKISQETFGKLEESFYYTDDEKRKEWALKVAITAIKHKEKPSEGFYGRLASNEMLFEKHSELMSKIFEGVDPLQVKKEALSGALNKENLRHELDIRRQEFEYARQGSSSADRKERLVGMKERINDVRGKLECRLGKTGNTEDNTVTSTNEKTAQIQTNVSKAVMKNHSRSK